MLTVELTISHTRNFDVFYFYMIILYVENLFKKIKINRFDITTFKPLIYIIIFL